MDLGLDSASGSSLSRPCFGTLRPAAQYCATEPQAFRACARAHSPQIKTPRTIPHPGVLEFMTWGGFDLFVNQVQYHALLWGGSALSFLLNKPLWLRLCLRGWCPTRHTQDLGTHKTREPAWLHWSSAGSAWIQLLLGGLPQCGCFSLSSLIAKSQDDT